MGYLTTFTVYNDGLSEIKDNADKFAEVITEACRSNSAKEIGLGCHVNLIKAQRPVHASDKAIFVHMGNCVTDVTSYMGDMERLAEINPSFAWKILHFMESEAEYLRSVLESNAAKG